MKKYKYNDVRKQLDTGDIMLFSSNNFLMSLWKKITACRWTHVGMVIRSMDTHQVLLWESTTLRNLCDEFSRTAQAGVQSVLLSQRLRTYKGDVAFRKLYCRLDGQARRHMNEELGKFRKKVQGRVFERNLLELLKAFIDPPDSRDLFDTTQERKSQSARRSREKGVNAYIAKSWSSIFCSELIAGTYHAMGLLDSSLKLAREYTPKDFSSNEPGLKLMHGAKLGKEKQIVFG